MDWEQMSVSRDRILSDDGSWSSYLENWVTTPPRPWDYSVTQSYKSGRTYSRSWDTVVPQWKPKINRGEIVSNDHLMVKLNSTFHPLYMFTKVKSGSDITSTYGGVFPTGFSLASDNIPIPLPDTLAKALALISSDAGSLRAEAVTTAFSRVDVSELEMLASLGEMPETIDWFGDVLRRLIAAMAMLKKRQYLDVMKQLKSLKTGKGLYRATKGTANIAEDTWMEWRYAIRPLIFEVKSYLEALDSKIETELRKTARKQVYDKTYSESIVTGSTSSVVYRADVRRKETTERLIRAGVIYSLDPELTGWWTHLGLDAPVSAAWAVTRLSFVLDWFFNIGQWIASWEPRLGLTPLTSWVVETRSSEIVGIIEPLAVPYPGYTILERNVMDSGGYSCDVQVKARWVNPDRQILPTFNFRGLDTAKVADLTVIGRKLASQLLR